MMDLKDWKWNTLILLNCCYVWGERALELSSSFWNLQCSEIFMVLEPFSMFWNLHGSGVFFRIWNTQKHVMERWYRDRGDRAPSALLEDRRGNNTFPAEHSPVQSYTRGSIQSVQLEFSTIFWYKFKGNVDAFMETAFMVNTAYVVSIRNVFTFQACYSVELQRYRLIWDITYST